MVNSPNIATIRYMRSRYSEVGSTACPSTPRGSFVTTVMTIGPIMAATDAEPLPWVFFVVTSTYSITVMGSSALQVVKIGRAGHALPIYRASHRYIPWPSTKDRWWSVLGRKLPSFNGKRMVPGPIWAGWATNWRSWAWPSITANSTLVPCLWGKFIATMVTVTGLVLVSWTRRQK